MPLAAARISEALMVMHSFRFSVQKRSRVVVITTNAPSQNMHIIVPRVLTALRCAKGPSPSIDTQGQPGYAASDFTLSTLEEVFAVVSGVRCALVGHCCELGFDSCQPQHRASLISAAGQVQQAMTEGNRASCVFPPGREEHTLSLSRLHGGRGQRQLSWCS